MPTKQTRTPMYLSSADLSNPIFDGLVTPEEKDALILQAQNVVDDIVGGGWEKYYARFSIKEDKWIDQYTTFPRADDCTENETTLEIEPFIPYGVSQACLIFCEIIFYLNQSDIGEDVDDQLFSGSFDSIKLGESQMRKSQGNINNDQQVSLLDNILKLPKGQTAFSYLTEYQVKSSNYE
jgi:hypothetical protein